MAWQQEFIPIVRKSFASTNPTDNSQKNSEAASSFFWCNTTVQPVPYVPYFSDRVLYIYQARNACARMCKTSESFQLSGFDWHVVRGVITIYRQQGGGRTKHSLRSILLRSS
jgi:hypothetical protein